MLFLRSSGGLVPFTGTLDSKETSIAMVGSLLDAHAPLQNL